MASFCKQCSIDIFGEDFNDLANITKVEDWKKELAAWVLCEDCGHTQVDPEGRCVRNDCDKKHLKQIEEE